jgi:hypothetical protein
MTTLGVLALASGVSAQAPPMGFQIPTWGPNGSVSALAIDGDTLYVGGSFDQVGPPTGTFALVNATDHQDFQTGANLETVAGLGAMEADGSGGWFVAGAAAAFNFYDRVTIDHILPTGTRDPAWTSPAFAGGPLTLARAGGRLFVAGLFSAVNGVPRSGLVALEPTTGAVLPWSGDATYEGKPSAVAQVVASAGRLFVAGYFDRIGGQPRDRFAVLDPTTGVALPPVLTGAPASPDVSITAARNRVYVHGACRPGAYVICAYDFDLVPCPVGRFLRLSTRWSPRPPQCSRRASSPACRPEHGS